MGSVMGRALPSSTIGTNAVKTETKLAYSRLRSADDCYRQTSRTLLIVKFGKLIVRILREAV